MIQEKLLITTNKSSSLIVESTVNAALGPVPDGCMRMSGVFGVTNVKNNNQRYYTNENYSAMVNSLNSRLDEGVFGQLEHPNNMDLNWDLVSHKIESVSIDEATGIVSGTVLLLPTEKGKVVQTLVKNGLKLKISSRAKGIVAEDGKVTLSHLETYDLVHRPGFSQARLNVINESVDEQGHIILETVEIDLNEKATTTESTNVDIAALTATITESVIAKLAADKSLLSETANQSIDAKVEEAVLKMQNHVRESMHKFATATQNWAINEFAPSIQGWVETVYETEQKRFLVENFATAIQNWTINEFAPQIQAWTVNEFAPQVQGWAINEFAPSIEKWLSAEYVPNSSLLIAETEKDLADETKKDEKDKDAKPSVDDKNAKADDDKEKDADKSSVDESLAKPALTILQQIDEQLAAATALATVEKEAIVSENAILEDQLVFETKMIQSIPTPVKHLWEAADETFKKNILSQAAIRNFTNESQITRFWMTRFTKNVADTIIESKKATSKTLMQINENTTHVTPKIANGLVQFCKSLQS